DLADGHGAGERVQDADLDRLFRLRGDDAWEAQARPERGPDHGAGLEEVPAGVTGHVVSFRRGVVDRNDRAASLPPRCGAPPFGEPRCTPDRAVRAASAVPNRNGLISLKRLGPS